jgi:hypothetical protein
MDDLEQLRRFRSQVPQPDDDGHARARRALIAEIDRPSPRGRNRVWSRLRARPAIAALVAAPATATIAVLAAVGAFGGSAVSAADAAIIRHADAAITPPPNMIFHSRVVGDGFAAESWQLTSPPYSLLVYKGPSNSPVPENAQSGSTSESWDPATNTIHEQLGTSPQQFNSPLADVRTALDRGEATVIGTATINGEPTYMIRFASKDSYNQALVAYVDKQTYRPVLLRDPQGNGSIVMLWVKAFEFLPANAANRRLLSLTGRHPTAAVVVDQSATPKVGGK